ncbi:MAG: hypothetical protein AABX30_00690 [Nanoarchaeota archaeon]
MKKVGGYILSLLGILAVLSGVKGFNEIAVKMLPFLSGVPNIYLIIIGGVLVILGVVFLKGSGRGRQLAEVPIYEGKRVVGYRRNKR